MSLRVWQTYRHAFAAQSSASSTRQCPLLQVLPRASTPSGSSIRRSWAPTDCTSLPLSWAGWCRSNSCSYQAQVAALELPAALRSTVLASSLLRGLGLSALVTPFVALAGLIAGGQVGAEVLRIALALGAVVLPALTPMQDHVRSVLYLCDRPQLGALVSACQLAVTIPALILLHLAAINEAWVPLSATAIGMGVSMVLGLIVAGKIRSAEPAPRSSTRELMRVGRPLLPAALVQEATVFAASATLVALTSAATLGTAEAARIVSRPVQAFSLGIARSLAPRLMESGQSRSPEVAKRAAEVYAIAIAVAAVICLAVAGWSFPHSPMVRLLPAAYKSKGLVTLFLVATSLGAIAQIPRGILLGAGEGRTILAITTMTSAVRLGGIALLAGALGAYALPSAQLASLVVTGWAGTRAVAQLMKRGQVALTCRHVASSLSRLLSPGCSRQRACWSGAAVRPASKCHDCPLRRCSRVQMSLVSRRRPWQRQRATTCFSFDVQSLAGRDDIALATYGVLARRPRQWQSKRWPWQG